MSSIEGEIHMSASISGTLSSVYATRAFWERLWRSAGIQCIGLFIIAYVIYGYQPQVGAPADALVAFYDGDRTRILIAAIFSGLAVLNLLWFAAAIRTTLGGCGARRLGRGGDRRKRNAWSAVPAARHDRRGPRVLDRRRRKSDARIGTQRLRVGLRRAHFVPARDADHVSGIRALAGRLISNALFAVGVAAVVLVLLGGTTWLSGGFWAPDGVYSRFVSPIIGLAWILVVSWVLLSRSPATRAGW